jgi:RNA recognition motif-containing protein
VTNLYVDNLSTRTSESSVRKLFERHGSVCRVHIVTVVSDQDASQPCRLGLVEMAKDVEGQKAIAALNGTKFGGSTIRVNEALTKRMSLSAAEWC